jgi:hypothetical protein
MSRETYRAAFRRHNFAEASHFLTMLGERFDGGIRLGLIDYGHHANPTIEGPQHFTLGDLSGGSEPLEHRQDRDAL